MQVVEEEAVVRKAKCEACGDLEGCGGGGGGGGCGGGGCDVQSTEQSGTNLCELQSHFRCCPLSVTLHGKVSCRRKEQAHTLTYTYTHIHVNTNFHHERSNAKGVVGTVKVTKHRGRVTFGWLWVCVTC